MSLLRTRPKQGKINVFCLDVIENCRLILMCWNLGQFEHFLTSKKLLRKLSSKNLYTKLMETK